MLYSKYYRVLTVFTYLFSLVCSIWSSTSYAFHLESAFDCKKVFQPKRIDFIRSWGVELPTEKVLKKFFYKVSDKLPMKVLALFLLFSCSPSLADFLDLPAQIGTYEKPEHVRHHSSFLAPNEEYPQRAKRIHALAPKGVYVSVGTERGFIGAASTTNASHLFLVDVDPNITLYNTVNTKLLAIARDRQHYLHLRLKALPHEWLHAAQEAGRQDIVNYFSNAKSYDWWQKNVIKDSRFQLFHATPKAQKIRPVPFRGANYLYDDDLFSKLSKMAKEGKIMAIEADLKKKIPLESIVKAIQKKQLPLSVLDISNAWQDSYMGYGTRHVIDEFRKIASGESILLVTSDIRPTLNPSKFFDQGTIRWAFAGFTFNYIDSHTSTEAFVSRLYYSDQWQQLNRRFPLYGDPLLRAKSKNCIIRSFLHLYDKHLLAP